jgi:hypothetical protein
LIVSEPRAFRRPRELLHRGGTPESTEGLSLGIGVVLLGRRVEQAEVCRRGIDLVDGDEALEKDPSVLTPARHLVISCPT